MFLYKTYYICERKIKNDLGRNTRITRDGRTGKLTFYFIRGARCHTMMVVRVCPIQTDPLKVAAHLEMGKVEEANVVVFGRVANVDVKVSLKSRTSD